MKPTPSAPCAVAPAFARREPAPLVRWLHTLWGWHDVARHRRALLDLDRRLLDDIGLTRAQALREAERPLWDAPNHWFKP